LRVACLHQPNFLPWSKLIAKVMASDVWIVYDTAQYTKTEFHSRQRVNSKNGPVWLSAPVMKAGRPRFQSLAEVELCADHDWRSAHLRLLREHYRVTPYWSDVFALLEPAYASENRMLVDFNLMLTEAVLRYLGSTTRVVRASALPHAGDRTDRLIQLNQAVDADVHLTSTYGSDEVVIDWERVARAGISVQEQRFIHPVYAQPHGPFVPGLSVIDLLCNCGPDAARMLRDQPEPELALAAAAAIA
jgi:hypothetical protein